MVKQVCAVLTTRLYLDLLPTVCNNHCMKLKRRKVKCANRRVKRKRRKIQKFSCADCGRVVVRTGRRHERCVACAQKRNKAVRSAYKKTPAYKAYKRAYRKTPEYQANKRAYRLRRRAAVMSARLRLRRQAIQALLKMSRQARKHGVSRGLPQANKCG